MPDILIIDTSEPFVTTLRGEILQSVREAVIADAEQRYLKVLMTVTRDMEEACAISDLSRSRLYALLKKYQLPSLLRNT